ncbi:MAG: hypothetical protein ACFFDD_05770 [Promethearchaeota archaeon]
MYSTGRDVLAFVGICVGLMLLIMGVIMYTLIGPLATIWFQNIFLVMTLFGFGLLAVGLGFYPGTRKRARIRKKVLEIAAVEKEVTISDLHVRTGIDPETVREILVRCLMSGMLFGYIEGDLFVRDTSARPFYFRGRAGLYGS